MKRFLVNFVVMCISIFALPCFSMAADVQVQVPQRNMNYRPARTIHVEGTASIRVNPDLFYVWVGILEEGESAPLLSQSVEQKMEHLVKILKSNGISDSDIQIQAINMYPSEVNQYLESTKPENPSKQHWKAFRRLRVTLHNQEKVSWLCSIAAEEGVRQITGPYPDFSNRSELERQAVDKAMEDAKRKASDLAQSVGEKLGDATNINQYVIQNYASNEYAQIMPEGSAESQIPIKKPTLIEARISVTFELLDSALQP